MSNRKQSVKMSLSPKESEVVALHSAVKAIDAMVNHLFFDFNPNNEGTEVVFKDSPHAMLFSSLLTDFITQDSSEMCPKSESRLEALLRICGEPQFNEEATINALHVACTDFREWLKYTPIFEDVYFADISLEVTMKMSRSKLITLCGTIVKHNEMSLSRTANHLKNVMHENGYNISSFDSYMMMEGFVDYFLDSVILYHASTLVQMLNDIRHEIKSYLAPESQKATAWIEDDMLKVIRPQIMIPESIKDDYSKACYHRLIQDVRSKSYVDRFKAPNHLKLRY